MTFDEAARDSIGTKWHHAGRSKEFGGDCAFPITHTLTQLGIPFKDTHSYGLGRRNMALYERMLEGPCERCEIQDAQFVLMSWTKPHSQERIHSHAAVITSARTMIHIFVDGFVFEEPFIAPWPERVISSWRIKNS
jgi:hypothetical protein